MSWIFLQTFRRWTKPPIKRRDFVGESHIIVKSAKVLNYENLLKISKILLKFGKKVYMKTEVVFIVAGDSKSPSSALFEWKGTRQFGPQDGRRDDVTLYSH